MPELNQLRQWAANKANGWIERRENPGWKSLALECRRAKKTVRRCFISYSGYIDIHDVILYDFYEPEIHF